jgi:integrase
MNVTLLTWAIVIGAILALIVIDLLTVSKKPHEVMFKEVAGLQESQRMHVLRHTCVSLLIAQGVNIKAIQAWVGHSSISQTLDTYGHLFPGSMSELAEKLDEYALLAASEDFLKMAN